MKCLLILAFGISLISIISATTVEGETEYSSYEDEDDDTSVHFYDFPKDQWVKSGETAAFTCIVKPDVDKTPYSLNWRVHQNSTWHLIAQDKTVKNNDSRVSVKYVKDAVHDRDEWTLSIQNVTPHDDGIYYCRILVGADDDKRKMQDARLHVSEPEEGANGGGGSIDVLWLNVFTLLVFYLITIN